MCFPILFWQQTGLKIENWSFQLLFLGRQCKHCALLKWSRFPLFTLLLVALSGWSNLSADSPILGVLICRITGRCDQNQICGGSAHVTASSVEWQPHKKATGWAEPEMFAGLGGTVMCERFTSALKASTTLEKKVDKERDVTELPAAFSFLDFGVSKLKCIWLLYENNNNNNNNNLLSHFRCVGICHLLWTLNFASLYREGHAVNTGNLIRLSLWKGFLGDFHF